MPLASSDKIKKLWLLVRKIPLKYIPRLLIFTDREYIVTGENNAHCCFSMYPNEEEFDTLQFSNDHHFRGKVLEIFSKFEFMIDELVRSHFKLRENKNFDDLLASQNLFAKIKLLNKWGIIDKDKKKIINDLRSVRNSLAHTWSGSIYYRNDFLNKNTFKEFKKDLINFWKYLLTVYKNNQPDIDKTIEYLENLSKNVSTKHS